METISQGSTVYTYKGRLWCSDHLSSSTKSDIYYRLTISYIVINMGLRRACRAYASLDASRHRPVDT